MICYLAKFGLIVAMGILMSAMSSTAAENPKKSEHRGRPITNWDASFSVVSISDGDIHGTSHDASITDYRLKLGRNISIDEKLTFNIGAAYGLKHMDLDSISILPDDLHAISLDLGGSYKISPKSFVSLKGSPGIYSDFSDDSANSLKMPLLLLAGHNYDNGIAAIAGFMYRFGYHSVNFIPAIGFSYQPNKEWRFDAIAPRPAITYSASRQLQIFVNGDFASDEYDISRKNYDADAIKYSDLKVSGGVNYKPIPPVKISAALGYAFDRQFTFYDGRRNDMRIDNAPFFRLSLDLGW